ncbi:MAG: lipopolysaccharide assembly protein LapB, partial [Gammaproteobacteria bacterium]
LFRRRGELARAIRIHQNLVARTELSPQQRIEAMVSLGQDYLSAGVFDQSERIFQEVVEVGGKHLVLALRCLLDIYQQEKSWQKAIHAAKKLESSSGEDQREVIAHHYCELVEESLKDGQLVQAAAYLKRAATTYSGSVRTSLLQAKMATEEGKYEAAVKYYQQVESQDPDYLSEAVPQIVACYYQLGREKECMAYLRGLLNQYSRISIALTLAEGIKKYHNIEEAVDFVADHLTHHASIRGLNQLIQWHIDTSYGKVKSKLQVLHNITTNLLRNKPIYRCRNCGFSGNLLHWLCPSCKRWNNMKPIHGLEGD